ncbi:MAG: hypothetical protein ACOX1P_23025 [Thermoguttaceae bacterium]|jgi:hypothetical protein
MNKRPAYRKPSKAQRRAALAELLAGLPDPPELPPEIDASVEDTSNTGSGNTCEPVTIVEDGTTMHGSDWTLPTDYQTLEVLDGALPSIKGCTPPEWPTLDAEDSGEGGVYP